MAYLAVNEDDSEFIYDYEIERFIGLCNANSEQLLAYEDLGKSNFWTMKNRTHPSYYGSHKRNIELPIGSIEKLIGRKLKWQDDPVKFASKSHQLVIS